MKIIKVLLAALVVLMALGAIGMAENISAKANATEQFTVFTDRSETTYVDIPPNGNSLGDAYYFNGTLRSENATSGPIVGEQFGSTTVVSMSHLKTTGLEQRLINIIFTFNNKTDQIVVGSVSDYPVQANTLEINQTIVHPILGGSGKYFGVRGQETSTHNADGSYTNVFTILR